MKSKASRLLVVLCLIICASSPFASGDASEAIKLLQDGLNAYRSKDYDSAIDKLREAVVVDPKLLSARFWLGMCYYLKGDLEAAEQQWQIVLSKKPNSTETMKWLKRLRAVKARKRLLPEGYEEALNAYRRGDYKEAQSALQTIVTNHPNFLPAQFWLGVVQMRLGNTEDAIKCFASVLRRKPSSVETMVWIGRLEEEQGRWEEALWWYHGALKINPRHREALEQYKRLIGTVTAKYRVGLDALAKGDYDRALQELSDVAPKMRWRFDIQFWYARALIANGKYEDAVKLLLDILRYRPNWASAICWLVEAYRGSGQVDEAAYVLATALRSNPTSMELKRKFKQFVKEHRNSVKLTVVRKPSTTPSVLVTLVNRCPEELLVHLGEQEIRLHSGAQHTLELQPSLYRYRAKPDGGVGVTGYVLLLGWHSYVLTFVPSSSGEALVKTYSDLVESFSPLKFVRFTVTNASSYKVSMRLNHRYLALEPKGSVTLHIEPGRTSYAVCIHQSADFTPGAMGEITLPEWRSLKLTLR
jgi:TolA-binding protein